jgi:hypothetical protein
MQAKQQKNQNGKFLHHAEITAIQLAARRKNAGVFHIENK